MKSRAMAIGKVATAPGRNEGARPPLPPSRPPGFASGRARPRRQGSGYVARHMQKLLPYLQVRARALTANAADAADLVQDTVERSLRRAHLFNPGTNLLAWMTLIMRRLFIDACRRPTFVLAPVWDMADPVPELDEEQEPEEWRRLSIEHVKAALTKLPDVLREAYVLFAFERATYRDIAERLGICQCTAGTRILRARAFLRKELRRVAGDLDASSALPSWAPRLRLS